MKKSVKNKGIVWLFIIITLILIIGHSVKLALAYNYKQMLYSIVPLLFIGIQTYRIYHNNIGYKGWSNSEIKPTTTAFILIGAPIPYFSYNLTVETGIWYWFSMILLVLSIIYFIYSLINITSVKNSFGNDSVTISDVLNIFDQKEIKYRKEEENINIFGNKLKNVISIPNYNCEIIKMRNKIVVKPNNRRSIKKVYEIIDLIERNS